MTPSGPDERDLEATSGSRLGGRATGLVSCAGGDDRGLRGSAGGPVTFFTEEVRDAETDFASEDSDDDFGGDDAAGVGLAP